MTDETGTQPGRAPHRRARRIITAGGIAVLSMCAALGAAFIPDSARGKQCAFCEWSDPPCEQPCCHWEEVPQHAESSDGMETCTEKIIGCNRGSCTMVGDCPY
jgi:hypothetical protein